MHTHPAGLGTKALKQQNLVSIVEVLAIDARQKHEFEKVGNIAISSMFAVTL